MAEYVPPKCDEPDCEVFAVAHVHIDIVVYPDRPAVAFFCSSHLRRYVNVLKKSGIRFTEFTV